MLKFGHRLRANYSNLIDICEGDGPPCDLIKSLYNLDLDSAVICELDIEEFSAKLEVLIEVPKANTFYAIVLTESGQLKKIDLAETYEWLVESPRKSVFQRVFERELELNKKYFVIKLLYPSLLSFTCIYFLNHPHNLPTLAS